MTRHIRADEVEAGMTVRRAELDFTMTVEHVEIEGSAAFLAAADGDEMNIPRHTVLEVLDVDDDPGEDDPLYLSELYREEMENPL